MTPGDTHIRDQSGPESEFKAFLAALYFEPHVSCPPVLPLRPHSGGASDKEGEGGDRSPPVPTVHTGACVTLLDYYYLSFPLSFDLSLSATLQNINFAF